MERGQLLENPRTENNQQVALKIVVADDLPESALELLRAEGWQVDARPGRPAADLATALADADGLLVRSATKVTRDLPAAAPRLRIVGRAGTGVDNIDVSAASARGVLVVNAPGANSISVAEHACALMLALARSVPAADRAMKDSKWEKKRFLGTELRGKTLGVAGLGRIGQEVAQRARAFGMRVIAHDPFISREIAAGMGVELLSLDEVCAGSDFLTLHLPSNDETGHTGHQHRARRADR
jgi:D-3-phosphoglycerate dehydrogenase / 2-oxoglutarate reductase